jgi:hypothetical protein
MVDTPRGNGTSMTPVYTGGYGYNVSVNYKASQGINRGSGADWFGPQNPQAPGAPPEVAGRAWNFMPGFNLNFTPRTGDKINFNTMRALADGYDLMRLVIETRKDQISRYRWKIRAKVDDNPTTQDVTTPEQQSRIDVLTRFFERPDGVNRWRPWLRSLLEDKFVIDAATLYKRRNRGGQLIGLEQIDGATIKVIIDDWGRTPQPYLMNNQVFWPPAFQQVLSGVPAVNYTVRDIIYAPYNKRVQKAYGYSEVEQVMTTVQIAMNRQKFQQSYYTEGNVPEALIGTPDGWTPEQIIAFQNAWDAMFTGNLAQRRHAKFVPGGVAKTFVPTKEPDLKNPMDEWLARIVCFAFSISPQGLVAMMNRATAQVAGDQAQEEGTEPLKEYVKELIDDVLEGEFESPDLEFAWDDSVSVDEATQIKNVTEKKNAGIITTNRARELLGEEKANDPGADVLMVTTGTGLIPIGANTLEGKQEAIAAGIVPDPLAPPEPFGGGDGGDDPNPGGTPNGKDAGKPKPPVPDARAQKLAARRSVQKAFKASEVIEPVPFGYAPSAKQERKLKKLWTGAFAKAAHAVAQQVRSAVLEKAAHGKTPDDIAKAADLSAFEEVIAQTADALGISAEAVATEVLARIGVDSGAELVNVVNARAVEQARQIAANMVGMRWNADGELVEAKRAAYRIDETTRTMIRDIITKGLEDNIGNEEIATNIENATAFSAERAALVAHTEIAFVNSMASLMSYKGARDDLGLNIKKEWLLGENPCDICIANNDQGAIDLDDEFQSGDDAPPAHPNCECAVSPVMDDDAAPDDAESPNSDDETEDA